ncbi:hypothetical protein [Burkholderia plantarii]|uniref:hypothetical protein n=1 Tax=Burkholderia plantarii TaxID=41899 RepID=UPI003555FAE4
MWNTGGGSSAGTSGASADEAPEAGAKAREAGEAEAAWVAEGDDAAATAAVDAGVADDADSLGDPLPAGAPLADDSAASAGASAPSVPDTMAAATAIAPIRRAREAAGRRKEGTAGSRIECLVMNVDIGEARLARFRSS